MAVRSAGLPRIPAVRLSPVASDEVLPRLFAVAGAMVLLALGARLLLVAPRAPEAGLGGPRVQLRLVAAAPDAMPRQQAHAHGPVQAPSARPRAGSTGGEAYSAVANADPPGSARAAAPSAGRLDLYDAQGRLVLPAGAVPVSPTTVRERDPFARANPVDYRGSRFEEAWVSDGDLADVAQQELQRAQRKVVELVFGKDIQHARARPAPEVRFNPSRHERGADLGSEATGDAWRAAPISYEPAPGLGGEASRRIRAQIGGLEGALAACSPRERERLIRPALQALEDLQRAEYALAHGADPVRAEHQLPGAANSAWDQARRALWYAGEQARACAADRGPEGRPQAGSAAGRK